ncbi:MAG: hypothetical protein WD063_16250 [Pirellulales bacterium]
MRAAPARRAICPIVVALLGACVRVAVGGSGTIITLPLGPKPTVNGLRLSVDCRWAHGYGYRPVRVDVSCTPPAAADRTLAVELSIATWLPDEEFVTVATDIEIPAGSAGVSRVVSVPQLNAAQFFTIRVWEDGSPVKDLSVEHQSINRGGFWGRGADAPRILFVAPPGPIDVSQFSFLGPLTPFGQQQGIGQPADAATFDQRTTADLVEDWINYSGLDLVFVSLADVRDLAANRPGVWQALRAWARSGGNLCVFGAGGDWRGLEEIEQLLGCPATDKEAAAPYRGWLAPSRDVFANQVVPAMMSAQFAAGQFPNAAQAAPPLQKPAAPAVAPFVWKPAAFGRAVAIADAQPFPGESAVWRWLLASLDPARTSWAMRHGTVPDQDNPNFNDLLIADVGLPPIRAYQVLISLFVVAIGPVNYWILKRHGRLHMFLFTVPLAALITTAGLLAYALVADGFASRLRARSLSHLDQRAGEAVRLARLSYYLGLAPSGGLEFPADTAIVPLELNAAAGPLKARARRMVWRDRQYLTRGWLASRMPTQYVTVRADKTRRHLAIVPTAAAARATIKNRLGVHVKQLLWCDASGKLHHGNGIKADEQAALAALVTEAQIAAALVEFLKALSQNAPGLPDAMLGVGSSESWFFPRARRMNRYFQNATVETSHSLLEQELAQIKIDVASRNLRPRSYLAIVERPAEIAAGTDGLTETQSLHVIRGIW